MKVVVALGGSMQDTALLRDRIADADLIIGANGGAARLADCGIRPALVIGDLDSVPPERLADLRRAGCDVLPHPDPQNKTDGQVALELGVERGATEVVLLGAHGGERLDHSLSNLMYAVGAEFARLPLVVIDGWTEAVGLRALPAGREAEDPGGRRSVRFRGETGDYVSLIPLSETVRGVSTTGLRWALAGATLVLGRGEGVSNELLAGQGGFTIEEGVAYATHSFRRRRLPPG